MPAALALAAGLALTVVDVDTVRLGPVRLRLRGLDGPEASDDCARGIRARGAAALRTMIEAAQVAELDFVEQGPWRPIVVLRLDGVDVAPILIAQGWAVPMGDTRRPWCAHAVPLLALTPPL